MVLDGPMDKEAFLVYVREILCPTLHPGDIVIADNLKSHKNEAVRNAIKAVEATIVYLPPYSPDFNPIEMVFSKLKALLKKAAPEPSTRSGTKSEHSSTPSRQPSVPITSNTQDMLYD